MTRLPCAVPPAQEELQGDNDTFAPAVLPVIGSVGASAPMETACPARSLCVVNTLNNFHNFDYNIGNNRIAGHSGNAALRTAIKPSRRHSGKSLSLVTVQNS